jgi:hypothetical protein
MRLEASHKTKQIIGSDGLRLNPTWKRAWQANTNRKHKKTLKIFAHVNEALLTIDVD